MHGDNNKDMEYHYRNNNFNCFKKSGSNRSEPEEVKDLHNSAPQSSNILGIWTRIIETLDLHHMKSCYAFFNKH